MVKKPKKKKRGPNKQVRMRRLLKKCAAAASEYVRRRDKSCLICVENGVTTAVESGKLNAHHWIISAARSVKHRFNPKNMVSLCWAHHLHGVHKEASYSYLLKILEAAIKRGIVTEDEILTIAKDTEKLEITEDWLLNTLAALGGGGASQHDPQPTTAAERIY